MLAFERASDRAADRSARTYYQDPRRHRDLPPGLSLEHASGRQQPDRRQARARTRSAAAPDFQALLEEMGVQAAAETP